jgi:hypothetical protein
LRRPVRIPRYAGFPELFNVFLAQETSVMSQKYVE